MPRESSEPLFILGGAGHETRADLNYYHDARKRQGRPQATLQLTLAGEGYYASKDGRVVLKPGMAFFDVIPGPFEYGYHQSPRPYELVFVSLSGSAMQWHRRINERFGTILDFGRQSAVQEQMLGIAHALERHRLPDRYQLSAMLYRLIMSIYGRLSESRLDTTPRVQLALEMIERHAVDQAFDIDALARLLDCSREHLARQFRATLGTNPLECLTRQRLKLAAFELRGTSDKLDVVARRCGFADANYLCRVFRANLGITPAKFRSQPWLAGP